MEQLAAVGATVVAADLAPLTDRDNRVSPAVYDEVLDVTDLGQVQTVFERYRPACVLHAASMIDLFPYPGAAILAVNCSGTANVIQACHSTGVRALVYTSSGDVVSRCV